MAKVLITGGPGIGISSMAKMLADESLEIVHVDSHSVLDDPEKVEKLKNCFVVIDGKQEKGKDGNYMKELMEIIKKLGMDKDSVIQEAECVEECGEWMHIQLMGYGADKLREAADLL